MLADTNPKRKRGHVFYLKLCFGLVFGHTNQTRKRGLHFADIQIVIPIKAW